MGLWLTSIGVTGFWAGPLGWIASIILGSILDRGILAIDLSVSSIRVALEDNQYRALAKQAYAHATARVYTEAEKGAIRKQYLDVIAKFGAVGDGVPDGADS